MTRKLIHVGPSYKDSHFAIHVPNNWDYWTVDGKRVNFRFGKLVNPDFPQYAGYTVILWIFSIYLVWRRSLPTTTPFTNESCN